MAQQALRILRRDEVIERTSYGRSKIDTLEANNKFPKRIRLGERAVGWYEHEIDEYLAALPRAENAPPDAAGNLAARGWNGRTSKQRAEQKRAARAA